MSVTINIDEAMWRAAEQATDIHDPTELVRPCPCRSQRSMHPAE
jgi:hypothetical protein